MIELFHSFERVLYHILLFYQSSTVSFLGASSYWVAIVLMTVTVRAALLPLVVKQVRSARAMRAIQPQLKALRERHGKDQAKLMEETTRLTREHGVNPLAGCLPLLAQAPVFIALSRVIWSPKIDGQPNVLRGHLAAGIDLGSSLADMSWVHWFTSPGGLLILSLIVIAAITTTITQRLAMAQQPTPLPETQRRLLQLMPLLFPLMWIRFPLASIMYWVTSNLWTLGQQWIVSRTNPPLPATAASVAPSGSKAGKESQGTGAAGGGSGRGGRRPAQSGSSTKRSPAGAASPSGAPGKSAKSGKRSAKPGQGQRQGQRQGGAPPAPASGGGAQSKRAKRRAAQGNGSGNGAGGKRTQGNGARNGAKGNVGNGARVSDARRDDARDDARDGGRDSGGRRGVAAAANGAPGDGARVIDPPANEARVGDGAPRNGAPSNGARRDSANGAPKAGVHGNGARGAGVTRGDHAPAVGAQAPQRLSGAPASDPGTNGGSAAGAGFGARRRRDRKAKPRQGS